MELQVNATGFVLTPAIEAHATNRLMHALNQHAALVERVIVMLKDLNGPKGGMDKSVNVAVRTVSGETVIVEETQSDVYGAISTAANRLKNTVGRLAGRKKSQKSRRRGLSD